MSATHTDTSPASEPSSTVTADASSPGDGYGSSTVAFGTGEILKAIPAKAGLFARITSWIYKCGGTAHTVTTLVVLNGNSHVSSDAASAQAVIGVDTLPTSGQSGLCAASDYVMVQAEDGVYDVYKVASVTATTITVTVSVGSATGSGLRAKVIAGKTVWFFGAATDHPSRQFAMPASTTWPQYPVPEGWCTSPLAGQPLLIHSDNVTATGTLYGPTYKHDRL